MHLGFTVVKTQREKNKRVEQVKQLTFCSCEYPYKKQDGLEGRRPQGKPELEAEIYLKVVHDTIFYIIHKRLTKDDAVLPQLFPG